MRARAGWLCAPAGSIVTYKEYRVRVFVVVLNTRSIPAGKVRANYNNSSEEGQVWMKEPMLVYFRKQSSLAS